MSIYKALSAVAAAAFVAAIVVAIPSPEVEARTPTPAQIDRPDVQPAAPDCTEQAWPYYDASCLRSDRPNTQPRTVRIVTTDRVTR